jgi:hypothetical protein
MNKPKAYIGVVTDIADSTIQIKTNESEIKQISVADTAITVVNIKGSGNKQVKLTDIAIGDFIVAMGYINSSSVLGAQRVLITDPVTESKVNSYFDKVSGVTKKDLTVQSVKNATEAVVTPGKNTGLFAYSDAKLTKIKLSDFKTSDLVILVQDESGDSPEVRSIFDIGAVR